MRHPIQNLARSEGLRTVWNGRTVDHDDRKAKRAGGSDFGVSPSSTGILGYDNIDSMISHQGLIISLRERSTRHQDLSRRQRKCSFRWVHQTQQIEVLRVGRELCQMHASNGQHDALRGEVQRRDSARDVGHMGPNVTRFRLPWRAGQSDQWDISQGAGDHGIAAHLRGEGMGRVNQMRNGLRTQKLRQPVHAAKAANPLGQGLTYGAFNPTREGYGAGDSCVGQRACERCGFRCAAKDQEVGCDG